MSDQNDKQYRSGQGEREQPRHDAADDQAYGLSGAYGEQGTLDEGFGQGQQMGEDQWPEAGVGRPPGGAQRSYGAGEVREFHPTEGSDTRQDDLGRMAGGMFGEDDESRQ